MKLADVAYARSGDKGDTVNIGVAARRPEDYEWLRSWLTATKVEEYFSDLVTGDVIRYELPNLSALNFILPGALDGGGAKSLRLDPQGKTICDALMFMVVDDPGPPSRSGGTP